MGILFSSPLDLLSSWIISALQLHFDGLLSSYSLLISIYILFTMGYAILPALIQDIEKVFDVYFNAFKHDEMGEIMVEILFLGGIDSEEFRKVHREGILAWWHYCDYQYTYKCVDTETGEIVGMAFGDIYLKERSEEERRNHGATWLEGKQRERAEAILNPLHDVREKLFGGRRYICES